MPVDLFKEDIKEPVDLFANQAGPKDLFTGTAQPVDLFRGPAQEEPSFGARHPNLYGIGGAAKETGIAVTKMVPYAKYFYPSEKEKFLKLSKQHQIRDLLIEDLQLVTIGFAKPIIKGVSPVFKALFPKTFKALTTPLGRARKAIPTKKLDSAGKVETMYDEAEAASEELGKTTASKIYKELKTKTVDVSGNVKKELLKKGDLGKKAVIRHDLIAGASPKALQEFESVATGLFRDLSSMEQQYLNRIIQSRRTIAIEGSKKIRHPKKLGAAEHQEWLDSIPSGVAEKLNARADSYFKVMRNQLDKLYNEGLVGDEAYAALVESGDYSPRRFLQHIDPERTFTFAGKKITVPDSGIQKLASGSEGLLENDAKLLMEQVISRTEARIFRNNANKAMYDIAENVPGNGIVRQSEIIRVTKAGKPVYEKAPAGHETISVMIDGQAKEMIMPTELAKEWVMKNPEISPQIANFMGWISGNKILKPMATGLNPEFALTNFPRDIAHIWLTTQEYSQLAPKAALQMARDVASVAKDAITRKGAWTEYINEGGGMEFLTHQGRITSKVKGGVRKIQEVMGWLGETSEITTRLALRQRALRNGLSPEEATWVARNYLDFSQGGSWAKAADTGIPYLNAAIQGTRGIFRSAAQKPGQFAFKVSQIGTLASGLYLANKNQNPEAWAQISDRDKVNNWIITTPFSYKDKDGTKKHIYFKIAKDQGQRAFATAFENLMAKYMGEEVNDEQITQAIQDAIPLLPTDIMPPSLDALMGYVANKDFWRNEEIWRGPNIEAQEEYNRYTHPGFVSLGKRTGLSPERTKYALSQLFTQGNIYTSMVGYGWNQLMEGMPEAEKEKITEELILNKPFIRRMVNETDPYYQYGKDIKDIDRRVATEKYILTRNFDEVSQKYYDKELTRRDIRTFMKDVPKTEKRRLWERHIRRGRIQDLPEKRWWLSVASMDTPEAKALVYWNRWRESTDEQRRQLDRQVKKVPGIVSGKFFYKLNQLKRKQ